MAAAGIGIYVWIQVQSMSGSSLAPAARSNVPPEPRPAAAQPAVSPPAIALAPAAAQSKLPPLSGSTASEAAPQAASAVAPRAAVAAPDVTNRAPRPEGSRQAAGSDSPANGIPIRLTRTQPEPDANAQSGYAKLQGNQLDAARQDYEQALRSDPNNVDTLLAPAAIAQRQGRPADASRYQQRAIEADPRNPAAQAALLGGSAGGDQLASESRLKNLLAAQPESGPLNFTLGNLYSR